MSSLAFVLSEINFVNSSIQFTIEEEIKTRSINFLDLNSLRDNNGYLQLKIFRKPTNTDKQINFPVTILNNIKFLL